MTRKPKRFADLRAVEAERQRLTALRDGHADRLQAHLGQLAEQDFRREMAANALRGAFAGLWHKGTKGGGFVREGLLGGLKLALGANQGSWAKRAGLMALGWAAPSLLKTLENVSWADIGHEVGISMGRARAFWRERRARHAEQDGD
ncbi:MAG: hypothetical protein J5I62_02905 [Flavobacteriales bacterium]|nr:hypothetical protein [Flavobacteriales bacterium]MEB2341546.1 hypothetical protein [Flavobacteriia bacterium]